MSTIVLAAGDRLYCDSLLGRFSQFFTGTTWAWVYVSPHATFALVDAIQGNTSVVGRAATLPILGSWDHGHDSCTSAPNVDNIDPYHSFFWWGIVDGYLQLEIFDGRPTSGLVWGTSTNLTVRSATRIPTGVWTLVAFTASWANTNGAIGTYTLYVNAVSVGSDTTNANTGHGNGDFWLDYPSLTIGVSKDDYHPARGTIRMLRLHAQAVVYTASDLLTEYNSPCAEVLTASKYKYQLTTATDFDDLDSGPSGDLTLDAGAPTTGQTDPCNPLVAVPLMPPSAVQTPCTPQALVENGGKGKAGCNVGGVGGGHQWSVADGIGDVPQHADPDDGEVLRGDPAGTGLEPWIELVHTDYPSDVKTTYRRAFEELADDFDYEGGRKESGVLAIGEIEHGLGNEQGGFEAATVEIELSDIRDRLIRDLADDQDFDGDECRVKLASDGARAVATTPRVCHRGIVQKAALESTLRSRLTSVDWLFSDFGPFGPNRKHPNWTFGDLGSAAPAMTSDTKAQCIPTPYGEISDEDAVDPLTNLPAAKGKMPGFYLGKFDLTGLVDTPPDTDGRTLAEVVALINGLLTAGTPAGAGWTSVLGFDIGFDDTNNLIAMGVCPDTYDTLAHVIGYADLDELLRIGTTAAPAATEWGFIATGLGPWFMYTGVYGSDLGGGDPTKTHDRIRLDPSSRSDILIPGINWPFAVPYFELTNPDTGRTFWLTGAFVTGPLLEDHLNGTVTLAFNAITTEDVGDGTGLPIMRVEDAKQHCLENHWINQWSSGPYATDLVYPTFEDGVPKVRSSSFRTRQNFFKAQLGSEGLLASWYSDKQQSTLDVVRQWNRDTDSRLGVNQHGQIMDWGLDETVDPSSWPRLNHVTDVFGPIVRTSGEERENVVTGSCDWDPDFEKYRTGPFTFTSDAGIQKYKGRIKQGDVIESQLLDNGDHFQWVLQRRLSRLQFGTTLLEVPGPIDPWLNYDVGDGVLFNSEDGPGPDGYEDHAFVILRRKINLVERLVTFTLWDVQDIFIATLFENGLDRIPEETTVDADAFLETDDADLAPLEMR